MDFNVLEQMSITLTGSSEPGCVMITTKFDGQTDTDKQFQIQMQQPSASTEPIYMPSTTKITITNRTSKIFFYYYSGDLTHLIVPLPTIMPSEKNVSTGKSIEFKISISFRAMKYHWQHNNMSIADGQKYLGVTTKNLTVMSIAKGDAGSYSCIVTTEFGLNVTSQQAHLKVCKYENC
jgi:hypothetical protein